MMAEVTNVLIPQVPAPRLILKYPASPQFAPQLFFTYLKVIQMAM
jgi:hypothetical protein